MTDIVYIENDNLLELNGLKNNANGLFVNDATVTVTVKNSNGDSVSGQSWPTAMNYVAASNGNYQATLEDTLVIQRDKHYIAEITANGGGLTAKWEFQLQAKTRR